MRYTHRQFQLRSSKFACVLVSTKLYSDYMVYVTKSYIYLSKYAWTRSHTYTANEASTYTYSSSSSSKVTTLMFLGNIKGCGHQRYKHISNRHIHIYMETLYGIGRLLPRTRTRIGTISPLRVWICVCEMFAHTNLYYLYYICGTYMYIF